MDEIKVLLIIASKGFQPIEYDVTKQTIIDAGFTVITASNAPYIPHADRKFNHISNKN